VRGLVLAFAIGVRTASAQEPSAAAQPARAADEAARPSSTAASFAAFGSQPVSDEVPAEPEQPAPRASVTVATRATAQRDEPFLRRGEADCDGPRMPSDVERCSTPREGVLSGYFVGAGIGYLSPRSDGGTRAAVGSGWTSQVQLGLEFYDHMLVAVSFGGYVLSGTRTYNPAQAVCDEINARNAGTDLPNLNCTGPTKDSDVSTYTGSAEVGFQHRFRPSFSTSWAPGLVVGYLHAFGGTASIGCEKCGDPKTDFAGYGAYLAPFVRLTFGTTGDFALLLRSDWFVSGDLQESLAFGLEYGLP